jgi:hypothetical protein
MIGNAMKRLVRGRLLQLIVAGAVGTIAGLLVFSITGVTGRNLFLITGAIAGVVAVFVIQFYRSAAQLAEVKVTIPQFSELTFVVNNDARRVAWKLFVETVTRIATEPLEDETGLIREALTSLYKLFSITREILKDSRPSLPAPGSQTVEHLAVTMLNWELRPLLSKWHPQLRRYEHTHPDGPEDAWPGATDCRQELRQAQERLRAYALGFAQLAGVRDAEAMVSQVSGGD